MRINSNFLWLLCFWICYVLLLTIIDYYYYYYSCYNMCVYKQNMEEELREKTHLWRSGTHSTEYRPTGEELGSDISDSTKRSLL